MDIENLVTYSLVLNPTDPKYYSAPFSSSWYVVTLTYICGVELLCNTFGSELPMQEELDANEFNEFVSYIVHTLQKHIRAHIHST